MTKFKVTTNTGHETMVEADAYADSPNGQWIDFTRVDKDTGAGYRSTVQTRRVRAEDVRVIELVEE
jgi:hypothetical protein